MKIKSKRSEQIRETIHRLCTEEVHVADLNSFIASFSKVEDSIQIIKDACRKREEPLFQQIFQYQTSSLSPITQHLPTYLKDPILASYEQAFLLTMIISMSILSY